jgi:aminomethyltransferase
VSAIADGPLPERFRAHRQVLSGRQLLVCGTGYTGEEGVELLCDRGDALHLWDAVVARGATPVGLAARNTLRLEVGYHLYGNDLMGSRGPIEAGLGWCCKEDTGFIGADAIRAARTSGPAEKLVAFTMEDGIARQGNPVIGGGEVTSGTMAPSLGIGIGMAYVPAPSAAEGTRLEIDVRGRSRFAHVAQRPLYKRADH